MPGETGDSSPNPFAVDPEGNYGTLNPAHLTDFSVPGAEQELIHEFPSPLPIDRDRLSHDEIIALEAENDRRSGQRLVDVRAELAKVLPAAIRDAQGYIPDDEDGFMLSMMLDQEVDLELKGEQYTAQFHVPDDAPPAAVQIEELRADPRFRTLADAIARDKRDPLFVRWKTHKAWELANSLRTAQTS